MPRGRSRSRARRSASTSSRPPAGSPRAPACPTWTCPRVSPRDNLSVKAAVLPFARFPGADPVLGPEMRSTGEVMASAADLPTALAKAERAAGRPLPMEGTAFLSVRDADKPAAVEVAESLSQARLPPRRDRGHGACARAAGHRRRARAEGDRDRGGADRRRPHPARALRPRRQHALRRLGSALGRLPDPRGGARRAGPVHHDDGRREGGRARDRGRPGRPRRLAPRANQCAEENALSVLANEAIGPYTLLRVERGGLDPGIPGQFFMLEAPGRLLPRPMSLCQAPPGELRFLLEAVGPGTRALAATRAGRRDPRLRPARQRLPARRRRSRSSSAAASASLRSRTSRSGSAARRRSSASAATARRGSRARPERRGRRRANPRHRAPGRPSNTVLQGLRVRAGADARGRARAGARCPARLGGADGLRLRRVLRLLRGDRRRPPAPLRRRASAGGRVILNASGCLDALEAPEVARALDAFVTKTVTPLPREGNRPVRIAETDAGHAQLDRPREPGRRRPPRRQAARAWPSSASRSGSRSAGSPPPTTRRSAPRSRNGPK